MVKGKLCIRILLSALLAFLLMLPVGCDVGTNAPADTSGDHTSAETDVGTHAGTNADGTAWFDCEVLEVNGASIRVMPARGTWEHTSAGEVGLVVSLTGLDETARPEDLAVGDTVRIVYDGLIATSDPGQIFGASSIELLQKDSEVRVESYDGINE